MKKILLFFAAAVCAIASWAQTGATVSATVTGEELTVALTEDGQQFVAFQMDITLPEGVTVENTGAITMMTDRLTQSATAPSFAPEETVSFKALYNVLPGNKLRVIAYNLENREIGGNEGDALFKVALNGTSEDAITVSNIKFVTKAALDEIELPAVDAVTEEGFHPYDVNKSGGEPDIDDALLVLRHIANEDPYNADYDVVKNDEVDIDDALAILRYLSTLD